MLESVGASFRRDYILKDRIAGNMNLIPQIQSAIKALQGKGISTDLLSQMMSRTQQQIDADMKEQE